MTIQQDCPGTYEDFRFYGYGYDKKCVCNICNKDHFRYTLKDKLSFLGLSLGGVGFVSGVILFAKVWWCIWLSDNSCWSHFP